MSTLTMASSFPGPPRAPAKIGTSGSGASGTRRSPTASTGGSFTDKVNFIWSVADLLRGTYKLFKAINDDEGFAEDLKASYDREVYLALRAET